MRSKKKRTTTIPVEWFYWIPKLNIEDAWRTAKLSRKVGVRSKDRENIVRLYSTIRKELSNERRYINFKIIKRSV